MSALVKYRYSLFAGACAAGGSFFGKLPSYLSSWQLLQPAMQEWNGIIVFTVFQVLPLAVMALCNILNWRYFLRALQAADQTLTATVLTAASNYMMSFILGILFYGEPASKLTVLGSTLIVVGLWFLCDASTTATAPKVKKRTDYKFKKT